MSALLLDFYTRVCVFFRGKQVLVYVQATDLVLGADSPFFSTIIIFNNQPFSVGFRRFSRKKDPWKEWGRYPQNGKANPFRLP